MKYFAMILPRVLSPHATEYKFDIDEPHESLNISLITADNF